MGTYPKKVQLAWDVINQFIVEWKQNPYYYDNEFSIQAEIYTRIKRALEISGDQFVKADYLDKWVQKGYRDKQNWCRVAAEPPFYYKNENGVWNHCYPDIVIWGDKKPNTGLKWDEEEYWPALWVCEIKLNHTPQKNNITQHDSNMDVEKLKRIIRFNNEMIQYGCWINFNFRLKPEDKSDSWIYDSEERRLWQRECYFPVLEPNE